MVELNNIKEWWFTKKIEDFPAEELRLRIHEVMELKTGDIIQTIPYVGTPEKVSYSTNELIARCPATGYPDFYTLEIEYTPSLNLPELKSFKFYIMQFMEIPISHEHLANKIFRDFLDVIQPTNCVLRIFTAIRGGIVTKIEVSD
jgi:7-cyano-7-deazaguanine reductase